MIGPIFLQVSRDIKDKGVNMLLLSLAQICLNYVNEYEEVGWKIWGYGTI